MKLMCAWGYAICLCLSAAAALAAAASVSAPFDYNAVYCNGFMTLVAGASLHDHDCTSSMVGLRERIKLLSAQMVWMNSSLTIFSAFGNSTRQGCSWNLPGINVVEFNATQLLLEYEFKDLLPEIESWSLEGPKTKPLKHQYARLSDILRVLLAHKHRYTYLDYDVYYLVSDASKFLKTHVGAGAWSSEKHYLEISNSAFCLPAHVLEDMHSFIRDRIERSRGKYFYTELGPNMFHRVIYNKYPILMYTQNHPRLIEISDIRADVLNNRHEMLHMTGLLRGNQQLRLGLDLTTFIFQLRKDLKLPPLPLSENDVQEERGFVSRGEDIQFGVIRTFTLVKAAVAAFFLYVLIKLKFDVGTVLKLFFIVIFASLLF